MADSIDIHLEEDQAGRVTAVRARFGPHYVVEVSCVEGRTSFVLVATHHGFRADASEVDGELERIIEEIRHTHPDAEVD